MRTDRRTTWLAVLVLATLAPAGALAQRPSGALLVDEQTAARIDFAPIPASSSSSAGARASVDLADHLPPPGDQGDTHTCVAWAVAAVRSYQIARRAGSERYPSGPSARSERASPQFIYDLAIDQGQPCTSGLAMPAALEVARDQGIATLSEWPLRRDCHGPVDRGAMRSARGRRASTFRKVLGRLRPGTAHSADALVAIKQQIAADHPVLAVVSWPDELRDFAGGLVYRGPNTRTVNAHALVIVGFDETRSAFKVLNSYGTDWGNGGYAMISYESMRHIALETYVVYDDADRARPRRANAATRTDTTRAGSPVDGVTGRLTGTRVFSPIQTSEGDYITFQPRGSLVAGGLGPATLVRATFTVLPWTEGPAPPRSAALVVEGGRAYFYRGTFALPRLETSFPVSDLVAHFGHAEEGRAFRLAVTIYLDDTPILQSDDVRWCLGGGCAVGPSPGAPP